MTDSNDIDDLTPETGDATLTPESADASKAEVAPLADVDTETDDDADADAGIKGLPVSLEISLPAVTVTLDMVRSIRRGMTVPLGMDLSERMTIGVNGQHFGEGSFVQIGDKIGIQIDNWKPARPH
jgi:flagellar motor switch/type III secretory pathway protein FliN